MLLQNFVHFYHCDSLLMNASRAFKYISRVELCRHHMSVLYILARSTARMIKQYIFSRYFKIKSIETCLYLHQGISKGTSKTVTCCFSSLNYPNWHPSRQQVSIALLGWRMYRKLYSNLLIKFVVLKSECTFASPNYQKCNFLYNSRASHVIHCNCT